MVELISMMMMGVVAGGLGQPAGSGSPQVRGGEPAGLVPIDPNTSDASLLGLSFRQMKVDLRRPTGFDRVYRLPRAGLGAGGFGGGTGVERAQRYARVSGGLAAVFPRSEYVQVNEAGDSVAVVPPDTRWVIGDLKFENAEVPLPLPALNGVRRTAGLWVARGSDSRVDRRGGAMWEPVVAPGGVGAPTMMTDEGFRVRRVGALMEAARGSPVRGG